MEEQQKAEEQEALKPTNRTKTLGNAIFLLFIAAFILTTVLVFQVRYTEGLKSPWRENNLGALFPPLLLIFILLTALRIRRFLIAGKASSSSLGCMASLVLTIPLYLSFLSTCSYTGGGLASGGYWRRDKNSMREIAEALEAYKQDKGTFPSTLEALTRKGSLRSIPSSAYPQHFEIRYQREKGDQGFLLWLPALDNKWDIQSGPQAEGILSDLFSSTTMVENAADRSAPTSLIEKTYDSTNGAGSSGDVWRWGPATPSR